MKIRVDIEINVDGVLCHECDFRDGDLCLIFRGDDGDYQELNFNEERVLRCGQCLFADEIE